MGSSRTVRFDVCEDCDTEFSRKDHVLSLKNLRPLAKAADAGSDFGEKYDPFVKVS